jgi:hypothetical protein
MRQLYAVHGRPPFDWKRAASIRGVFGLGNFPSQPFAQLSEARPVLEAQWVDEEEISLISEGARLLMLTIGAASIAPALAASIILSLNMGRGELRREVLNSRRRTCFDAGSDAQSHHY